MPLFGFICTYLYLVGILHIVGMQAHFFATSAKQIRVGKWYRYEVYAVTTATAILLASLLFDEVLK